MIFLGETFSGFVTAHNDSQELVKDVVIRVSLQYLVALEYEYPLLIIFYCLQVELMTPSQRLGLLTTPSIPQIDGSGCEERIITHEVKELGEHSLICSASYTVVSSGEELHLRKYFKFSVRRILNMPVYHKTCMYWVGIHRSILWS